MEKNRVNVLRLAEASLFTRSDVTGEEIQSVTPIIKITYYLQVKCSKRTDYRDNAHYYVSSNKQFYNVFQSRVTHFTCSPGSNRANCRTCFIRIRYQAVIAKQQGKCENVQIFIFSAGMR